MGQVMGAPVAQIALYQDQIGLQTQGFIQPVERADS